MKKIITTTLLMICISGQIFSKESEQPAFLLTLKAIDEHLLLLTEEGGPSNEWSSGVDQLIDKYEDNKEYYSNKWSEFNKYNWTQIFNHWYAKLDLREALMWGLSGISAYFFKQKLNQASRYYWHQIRLSKYEGLFFLALPTFMASMYFKEKYFTSPSPSQKEKIADHFVANSHHELTRVFEHAYRLVNGMKSNIKDGRCLGVYSRMAAEYGLSHKDVAKILITLVDEKLIDLSKSWSISGLYRLLPSVPDERFCSKLYDFSKIIIFNIYHVKYNSTLTIGMKNILHLHGINRKEFMNRLVLNATPDQVHERIKQLIALIATLVR